MKNILTFLQDESGSAVLDYCFLGGIVTAAIAGPLKLIGQRLSIVFYTIAHALTIH